MKINKIKYFEILKKIYINNKKSKLRHEAILEHLSYLF